MLSSFLRSSLVAAGLVFGAWSAHAATDEAYVTGLYDAAVAAGETTVTVANPNTASNGPIFKAFEKRFPKVRIVGVDMFGAALLARVDTDAAAGKQQIDVFFSLPTDAPVLDKKGQLVSFIPQTAEPLPAKYKGKDAKWHDWVLSVGAPFYNNALVKPGDAPTSYADLIDKKWKGKISTGSLRIISGTGQALTALMRDGSIDRSWLQSLAANDPILAQGSAAAIQLVASGQAEVGLDVPLHFYRAAVAKGAPFTFIWPKEGVTSVPLNAALATGAPHPAAAKLLIAWFFTPECQKLLAEIGMQGTMPGAPIVVGAPEGGVKFHVIDGQTIADLYPAQLQLYKELFPN